ncbi:MAG: dicarboxylate/amino acid:cation symporter, partial [Oscillospiraceae bacterium]|nr:dicarboxylate/amino acid:cation symporter [Oscillospiraceae bacterium]
MANQKTKATKKSMHLTIAIFVGLVLGVLYGLVMPKSLETVTSLISSIYLHGLTMMIYPLVFCSLIIGIRSIGSVRKTGKIGGQALLYFCATTLFASLLGLVLPKALGLGNGISIQLQDSEIEAVAFSSLLDTLKNLIPSNPVASFANGNMLQVLAFAIIVGITCVSLKEKADPFVKLCESINDISIKIIGVVMYCTPVGVFCSLAGTVHSNGIQAILALGGVMLALYITYFLYIVIVYGLIIVKAIGKFSMKTFFVTILPAALNAFGTASSSATLPISKACTDEMEVPNEISSLALPLGATINMDAVAIVMTFMIVFFANA